MSVMERFAWCRPLFEGGEAGSMNPGEGLSIATKLSELKVSGGRVEVCQTCIGRRWLLIPCTTGGYGVPALVWKVLSYVGSNLED